MSKLRLSEAIRLGSLLVRHPQAGDIERCAITMALKAMGALPEDIDNTRSYRGGRWNQWSVLAYPEQTLREAHPWIKGDFHCLWCGQLLHNEAVVWHPFDEHVMRGRITIEQMCDGIASIEPACEPESEEAAAREVAA